MRSELKWISIGTIGAIALIGLSQPIANGVPGAARARPAPLFPVGCAMINVKTRYGALGNGRTDDTAAIQRAIDQNRHKFCTLYFPPGDYLISHTLTYGSDIGLAKEITLQGAGRDQTIIRLRNHAPGFANPAKPRPMLTMFAGKATGQAFYNSIFDMGFDTGRGNPGASGVQWMNNNVGTMQDVAISSGDPRGRGAIGIDLTRTEPGPGLIRNVVVDGFRYGVLATTGPFSMTFNHVTFQRQRRAAVCLTYASLIMHDIRSINRVPFALVRKPGGMLWLTQCDLDGGAGGAAIHNRGLLYMQSVSSSGYARLVQGLGALAATHTRFYVSARGKRYSAFPSPDYPPALLFRAAPHVPWGPPTSWVRVDLAKNRDAAVDAQAAIDRANQLGRHTVYFPGSPAGVVTFGHQVRVYGSVTRIFGMDSIWYVTNQFNAKKKAIFLVRHIRGRAIEFSRFTLCRWQAPRFAGIDDQTRKTVILRDINTYGSIRPYIGGVPGSRVFLSNICGSGWHFNHQHIWAQQLDVESNVSPNILNDGGTLWILGLKAENGASTLISTVNGGTTKLIGGFNYSSWPPLANKQPMFLVNNALASFSIGCLSFVADRGYRVVLREVRGGYVRNLSVSAANCGGRGSAGSFLLVTAEPFGHDAHGSGK
jgi:hypothetical protein